MVSPDSDDVASYPRRYEHPGNGDRYPHTRIEKWLCNHCGDYVEPGLKHLGNMADTIHHLQAEYVRSLAARLVRLNSLVLLKAQCQRSGSRCGSILVPTICFVGYNCLIGHVR
jgi:hypothetical protein